MCVFPFIYNIYIIYIYPHFELTILVGVVALPGLVVLVVDGVPLFDPGLGEGEDGEDKVEETVPAEHTQEVANHPILFFNLYISFVLVWSTAVQNTECPHGGEESRDDDGSETKVDQEHVVHLKTCSSFHDVHNEDEGEEEVDRLSPRHISVVGHDVHDVVNSVAGA